MPKSPIPGRWSCGCERKLGDRQCMPCKLANDIARRAGLPTHRRHWTVTTHFRCGHPYIPSNITGNGKSNPKGRCRYCRHGILTFDLNTGAPMSTHNRKPLSDFKIRQVQRMLAKGISTKQIIATLGVSRMSVSRIANGKVQPSKKPKPAKKPEPQPPRSVPSFELVSVRPLPPANDPNGGRSYSFPPKYQGAA